MVFLKNCLIGFANVYHECLIIIAPGLMRLTHWGGASVSNFSPWRTIESMTAERKNERKRARQRGGEENIQPIKIF